MHSCPLVDSCPSLDLDEHLYMDARLNMDCHFILGSAEILCIWNQIRLHQGVPWGKMWGWFAKKRFERGFFTLFQHSALYDDHDLCPPSFDATMGESVLMCCPVQGFPPPQVSWELPNGTLLETGSTILHVTVKTKNDFGRYRCIARSLEKNVRKANITIRERSKYKRRI